MEQLLREKDAALQQTTAKDRERKKVRACVRQTTRISERV
jgi:hypothetical protein